MSLKRDLLLLGVALAVGVLWLSGAPTAVFAQGACLNSDGRPVPCPEPANTKRPSRTRTPVPSATLTSTATFAPTETETATAVPSATPTASLTPTPRPSPSPSPTPAPALPIADAAPPPLQRILAQLPGWAPMGAGWLAILLLLSSWWVSTNRRNRGGSSDEKRPKRPRWPQTLSAVGVFSWLALGGGLFMLRDRFPDPLVNVCLQGDLPDLIVTKIEVEPSDNVYVTVKNIGSCPGDYFYTMVTWEATAANLPAKLAMGGELPLDQRPGDWHFSDLPAQTSRKIEFHSDGIYGIIYIEHLSLGAMVDAFITLPEQNEYNNILILSP